MKDSDSINLEDILNQLKKQHKEQQEQKERHHIEQQEELQKQDKKINWMILISAIAIIISISALVDSFQNTRLTGELANIVKQQFSYNPFFNATASDIITDNSFTHSPGYNPVITVQATSNHILLFNITNVKYYPTLYNSCFFTSGPNMTLWGSYPVKLSPNQLDAKIHPTLIIYYNENGHYIDNFPTGKHSEFTLGNIEYNIEVTDYQNSSNKYEISAYSSFNANLTYDAGQMLTNCTREIQSGIK